MRIKTTFFSLLILLVISSCVGTKFTSPNFDIKTAKHRVIAVLPFEMVYTGKMPENMTAADIEKIRYAEAMAFQKSLYDNILRQSGGGKKDVKIEIQPIEKTTKMLQDSGLNYLALSTTMPEVLCKKLGVDAVVYSKIEKERFLSDLESFGISIAQDILDKIRLNNPTIDQALPMMPGNVARTYNIKADCQLKNSEDGSLLWKYAIETDTDWQTPANEVIGMLNRRFSKKFPYRNRRYEYGKY